MCIIAAKAKGVKMPSEETLRNMWDNNDDGAGFMYAKDGYVYVDKGYMDYQAFYNALQRLSKTVDLTQTALVMHFRITTHGGTKAANTHPFPITDSVGMLQKLRLKTKLAVAHNGIIPVKPRKGISDTMEYIAGQLAPLAKALPSFYRNPHTLEMIANATDSKLAFLDAKGDIYTVGDFVEDDGVLYSNHSYQYNASWRSFTWGRHGGNDTSGYASTCYTGDYGFGIYAAVQWVDGDKGEYVIDDAGMLHDPEDGFVFDSARRVYAYDYDIDGYIYCPGWQARNAEGGTIAECADLQSHEYLFDPYRYDEDEGSNGLRLLK